MCDNIKKFYSKRGDCWNEKDKKRRKPWRLEAHRCHRQIWFEIILHIIIIIIIILHILQLKGIWMKHIFMCRVIIHYCTICTLLFYNIITLKFQHKNGSAFQMSHFFVFYLIIFYNLDINSLLCSYRVREGDLWFFLILFIDFKLIECTSPEI